MVWWCARVGGFEGTFLKVILVGLRVVCLEDVGFLDLQALATVALRFAAYCFGGFLDCRAQGWSGAVCESTIMPGVPRRFWLVALLGSNMYFSIFRMSLLLSLRRFRSDVSPLRVPQ